MGDNKNPGPDGFSATFYKHFLNICKSDFITEIQDFFKLGILQSDITQTNIVLIPKKDNPKHCSEFRHISLTNVHYKVIAKILANRLKHILSTHISQTQHAFFTKKEYQPCHCNGT